MLRRGMRALDRLGHQPSNKPSLGHIQPPSSALVFAGTIRCSEPGADILKASTRHSGLPMRITLTRNTVLSKMRVSPRTVGAYVDRSIKTA
jgi:hypothetical protein